jgi:uncharacterized membrane protein
MDIVQQDQDPGAGRPPVQQRSGAAYEPAAQQDEARQPLTVGPLQIQNLDAAGLARALAWVGVGIGLAEILFPRTLARLIGAPQASPLLLRAFGVREIASAALVAQPGRPRALGLWARVAGDAVDLAMLASALPCAESDKAALKMTIASVLGVTAADYICAKEVSRQTGLLADSGALRVCKSITVNRPPEEVYAFWRELQNLPRFMYHVESIEVLSSERSRWTVKAPAGGTVQWEAEITADQPGQLLGWRTTDDADVANVGNVFFEPRPGGRGTIVRVDLEYRPPGHLAGAALAVMFNRNPAQQVEDDLRRFKQFIETGDLVRSDGSPEGTGRIAQLPARPRVAADMQ